MTRPLSEGETSMQRTIVSVIVAGGLVLAGCSAQPAKTPPTSPAKSSSSAPRQVMTFGEERAGKRGIISVAKPAAQELPADPARAKDLTRGLRFDITVKNTSKQALQA